MTAKRAVVRGRARRDIKQARDFYLGEAAVPTAARFVDAIQAALTRIAESPDSGSTRYAHEVGLPGLRSYRLSGFPYLAFYVERAGRAEIWRVLHAQRDIPQPMKDPTWPTGA
jgi:toxin ParE1/3/4